MTPQVRKIQALPRFDLLHLTGTTDQENTGPVCLFLQRQSLAIQPQPGVALDEHGLIESQMRREAVDLQVGQLNLSRPPATGGATLAFPKNRHVKF